MRRKPEPTQVRNPRQLTVRQHVFPARSLERFARADGAVMVRRPEDCRAFPLKPNDRLFCALRVWDQRAESGFMKSCEEAFQAIAERIIVGGSMLSVVESAVATEFWALWRWRVRFKAAPIDDLPLPILGLRGETLTLDERDTLESKGLTAFTDDMKMSGRAIVGGQIQRAIDIESARCRDRIWGVVRAGEAQGEFILPDSFGGHAVIPLSPTILLVLDQFDVEISAAQVAQTNSIALRVAADYAVARDFAKCPVVGPSYA